MAFRDKEQIYEASSAWAKPSVNKAAETGIIIVGGLPDKFAPQTLSTRADAASAIVRMLKVASPYACKPVMTNRWMRCERRWSVRAD